MADNTNTSQKVLFKKGTKSDLSSLAVKDDKGVITGGYEPGCFYLTTDTHHLYIGTEDETLAKVNGNIHSIAKLPATGEPGEFYYLPAQNILAYYDDTLNDGKGGWIQLNPDTNTDTIIEASGLSFTKNADKSDKDTLTYTVTLTQKVNNDADPNKTITADLVISADDVTSIVTETAVAVGASEEQTGVVTVNTSGAGASGTGFQIKGSGNVTLSVDENDAVVIDSKEYSIGNNGNSIVLTQGTEPAGSVNLYGDDWIETAAGTANGSISISHKEKDWGEETTEGFIIENQAKLESGNTFTTIKDIDFDEAGHINSVTTQEYALPNTDYSISSNTTTVKDSEQNELYSYTNSIQLNNGADIVNNQVIDIDIALPITIDGKEKILHNGSTIGSFYSSDEINSKLKALNAMTYMGPVVKSSEDPSEKLPTLTYDKDGKLTSTIRKGDTYKVNEAGEYGPSKTGYQHNCEIGYLLIANSTSDENDDGYIHENLYWDLIESGESTDTTYTIENSDGTIVFKENGTDTVSSIAVQDDDIVNLEIVSSEGNNKAIILKASHSQLKTVNDSVAEDATGISYQGEFSAVTGVSRDSYGHVTDVTISKYSLPASDTIEAIGTDNILTFKDGNGDIQGSLKLKSGPEKLIGIESTGDKGALEVTLSHATVDTDEDKKTEDNPTFGGSFTAISSIGIDGYGHVDEIVTTTVTLPEESEYELEDPSKSATGVVSVTLKKDTQDAGTISLASDSLDLSVVNKVIYADLVWGSFI